MIIRPRNLLGLAGVLLIVLIVLVIVASGDSDDPEQVQTGSEAPQSEDADEPANPEPSEEPTNTRPAGEPVQTSPTTSQPGGNPNSRGGANEVPRVLWEVPGFRPRSQGPVSDDALYLWEAFKRRRYIQDCMAEKGFDYEFDLTWPGSWLLEIADSIGMVGNTGADLASGGTQQEPEAAKPSPDIDSFSAEKLERYSQALYDETTADVEVWRTRYLPIGRDTFATGGCYGVAQTAIVGADSMRKEINSAVLLEKDKEMLKAPSCTTPKGVQLKDLEALEDAFIEGVDGGENPQDVEADLDKCRGVLRSANNAAWERAETTVFEQNKQRLLDHAKHWFKIASEIPHDTEFTRYIQDAINDLNDSWTEVDTNPQSAR